MRCNLFTALAVGACVAAFSSGAIAQSSLTPAEGQSKAGFNSEKPFADLQIDHTRKYNVNEWSDHQRAEVNRRCQHIAQNPVEYQEQVRGFCTNHSSH